MKLSRKSLGLYLLALGFLVLFLVLGSWQVRRGFEKIEIADHARQQAEREPGALPVDLSSYESLRYAPIHAMGHYLGEKQFLLDNQVLNGQVGYNALAPFQLKESGKWVLVDRGWLRQGLTRQLLPDVSVDDHEIAIDAQLYVPFSEGYRVGEMDGGNIIWPRVVQYLDFDRMSERLGFPLLPLVLRLSPESTSGAGFERIWPTVQFGYQRHFGYAVQWFAMALALLVILVLLVRKKYE